MADNIRRRVSAHPAWESARRTWWQNLPASVHSSTRITTPSASCIVRCRRFGPRSPLDTATNTMPRFTCQVAENNQVS